MKREKKIFLSGPMTGYYGFNFGKFDRVASELRLAGADAVNPADICRRYKKERVLSDKATFDAMIAAQQEEERKCDAILLLDGWESSKGVRLELKTALDLGLEIWQEKDLSVLLDVVRDPGLKAGVTLKDLSDEDWKTQQARGYGNVPAGSRVLVLEEGYVNFYGGPWTRIKWAGNLYWVKPEDILILE